MAVMLRPDEKIAAEIDCILSDVDGVMTDGRIVFDEAGVETKRFHVQDGLGIKLWRRSGFEFGIVTSRTSRIVERRAAELGLQHVRQGCKEKLETAQALVAECGSTFERTCYIGDDLPDLPVMRRVALAVAPADAASDVQAAANWILRRNGGEAAVRELIERLLRAKNRWEEHVPR